MKRKNLVKLLLVIGLVLLTVLVVAGCKKKTPPPPPPPPAPTAPDTTGQAAREAAEREAAAARARADSLAALARNEAEAKKTIQPVYFDYDKYNLRPDARDAATTDAAVIQKFKNWKVRLEGNCDERGTEEYNLALGEKRANTVRDFLVNYGIDAGRLSTVSYGETRPADPGHAEAAWAKNRRVDMVIQ